MGIVIDHRKMPEEQHFSYGPDPSNGLGSFPFPNEKLLTDSVVDASGNYWVGERASQLEEMDHLYVFDCDGVYLKQLRVSGRPNLFVFGDRVIAGCEGHDGNSRIYEFDHQTQELVHNWTLAGFFWALERSEETLYVANYLSEEDRPVLYRIDRNTCHTVNLGEHFFPTDLLFFDGSLYVCACPILDSGEKKLIRLNEDLSVGAEYRLTVSPRQLYACGGELVVHGLELLSDSQEKLIYLNFYHGVQKEYAIPCSYSIKGVRNRLFLVDAQERTVRHWDHRQQKLTRVIYLSQSDPYDDCPEYS